MKKILLGGALILTSLFTMTACYKNPSSNVDDNKNDVVETFQSFYIDLVIGESRSKMLVENENFSVYDLNTEVEGKVFLGWYFDEDFLNLVPRDYKFTKEMTLYGKVEDINNKSMSKTKIEEIKSLSASVKTNISFTIDISEGKEENEMHIINDEFVHQQINQNYIFNINDGTIEGEGKVKALNDDIAQKNAFSINKNDLITLNSAKTSKNDINVTRFSDGSVGDNNCEMNTDFNIMHYITNSASLSFNYGTNIYVNQNDYIKFNVIIDESQLIKQGDKFILDNESISKTNAEIRVNGVNYALSASAVLNVEESVVSISNDSILSFNLVLETYFEYV